MIEVKVVTLNIWGLLYISKDVEERIKHLADELSKGEFDIVSLQEVWCQRHYNYIVKKVSNVFPYAHYFHSGFLGSGLAILSKYPIADTFYHKYIHNGYFWDVMHGDWFAGKGLGAAVIEHPKKKIYLFNTHLHAAYGENFTECRTLQMYQTIQMIRQTTRPRDAIIVCGDFNHEPHELGVEAITGLAHLCDSYQVAVQKPSSLLTCNTNVYRNTDEKEMRIDYIFFNEMFDCTSCDLAFLDIPDTNLCYSDHNGYTATLMFKEDIIPTQRKNEDQNSIRLLKTIHDVTANGEKFSEEIAWGKISLLVIIMLLLILLPLISIENFHFYFTTTSLTTWVGKFVFILQIIVSSLCLIFTWMVLVLRQIDSRSFRSISADIKTKIHYLEQKNHKKLD